VTPSGTNLPSSFSSSYLERSNLVNPHFLETKIFWRPGYLNLALRRDSMTAALFLSLDRMLMMGCPMWTRANGSLGFAEGTSHSSLEPISSGTRQHFVDADHMEGVNTHPDVECILTAVLHQVFVGANATGFEGFGRQLLVFIGHQMNTQRKVIYDGPFATQIEDPDLGIGDTSVEP